MIREPDERRDRDGRQTTVRRIAEARAACGAKSIPDPVFVAFS
jgi:hypothetical protein